VLFGNRTPYGRAYESGCGLATGASLPVGAIRESPLQRHTRAGGVTYRRLDLPFLILGISRHRSGGLLRAGLFCLAHLRADWNGCAAFRPVLHYWIISP